MTPEQMRIVIARHINDEFCLYCQNIIGPTDCHPIKWCDCAEPTTQNYPNNLNAMHEAEKTLTGNQLVEYIRNLKYVCNPGTNLSNEHNQSSHVCATAIQRAEAFIKTVCPKKWTKS